MSTTTHHRCMSGPGTIRSHANHDHIARILAARLKNDAEDLTRTVAKSRLPDAFWRAAEEQACAS